MRVSEPASAGVGGPLVRKPTHWASSALEALKRVDLRCANEGMSPLDPRWHEHDKLEGQRRPPSRPGTPPRCASPSFVA
eukprot:4496768-Alexandrium_andersonii.AAC.1